MPENIETQVLLNPDIHVGANLDAWFLVGGGEAVRIAMNDPANVMQVIADSGLRGMGGAGFPTSRKWGMLADKDVRDKVIICNGNEDEPGTFKDRVLLESSPHQVIEGGIVAALATGANSLYFYVNPHQTKGLAAMRRAVEQWLVNDLLQQVEKVLGKSLRINVVESSGLYIGGEETAVISSIEGGFPFPRVKPPFPVESGVFGQPTIINNVETLSNVSHIIRHGAEWYKALGVGEASGTKLYSLSGDVLKPGLYELPMGTSLHDLVFKHGGGMLLGKEFKAVFTGGPSNTLLTKKDLDVAMDFDSVRERNSRLGTGAMIVISEGTSIVRKVTEYMDFFAKGSCGQCPPCKSGTFQIARILERFNSGSSTQGDLAALENLCKILPGSGRCALIDGAVTVVESSLETFRDEYLANINRG